VGHYVLEPSSYGFWLRRDIPHLPVLFGDGVATIGPLVEPGVTACLYCLEHHRRDADASWSAIAAQLWGRRSSCETPVASVDVAARVARLVLARLSGEKASVATSSRLVVATGGATPRIWLPHPDCGCISLSDTREANEGRQGSGSAIGRDRPRSIAAAGAPG
jgi:bacteriocin biosynthesis cyclodehydratase domain-containing protein